MLPNLLSDVWGCEDQKEVETSLSGFQIAGLDACRTLWTVLQSPPRRPAQLLS